MNPSRASRPALAASRRRLLRGLIGLGALAAVRSGAAHGPEHHAFRMVAFDPPVPAPGFDLAALDGARLRLADLAGRHVLANFWATWCPPCVKELPSLDRLHARYRDRGLTVLGIALDAGGAREVGPFVERLGLSLPVALDPEGRVAARYGARGLPATFLIDPRARVVAAAQGERDWMSEGARSFFDELLGPAG